MDLGIEGRPALVAAASAGLGLACATALAREGARLAICGRDPGRLETAREHIAETTGRTDVVALPADVGTEEGAVGFVREATERLGGCEILVLNAGGPPPGRAQDLADEDYRRAIELNFYSTVRMVREGLPGMREAGYGRIVLIASSSVKLPIPGLALSNTARVAAAAFLKTLSREVAPEGITVNGVLPARFLTDRIRDLADARALANGTDSDHEMRTLAEEIPMGRLGDPMELGDLVAFLCSERASYLTGLMISVDGGVSPTLV